MRETEQWRVGVTSGEHDDKTGRRPACARATARTWSV